MLRYGIVLAVALAPFVVLADERDPWIGRPVLLKPGAAVTKDGKAVDKRVLPLPTRVDDIDQNRLSLGRAWVKKADVMSPDEAIAFCDSELKSDPKDARLWQLRGWAWYHKGEYQKARYSLDEALRLDPSLCEALLVRGLAWDERGDSVSACRDFSAVISIDPAYAAAYFFRARSRAKKAEVKEAIEDCGRAIELDPGCGDAFKFRGDAFCYQREFESAIRDYSEALRLYPSNFGALGNRAICRFRLRDADQGLRDIDAAIRLNPKSAPAHLARSIGSLVKGDTNKAIEAISESMRLEPRNIAAYTLRARMYRSLGDDRKALDDYETQLRVAPKNQTPKIDIIWILANSPDPEVFDSEKAISMAKEICEMTDWQHHDALAALAAAYAAAGDWEKAIQIHKDATSKTPGEFHEHRQHELQLYESHRRAGPTKEEFKKTVEDMFFSLGPMF